MLQIIFGIIITGALLYVSQFVALASLGTQFLAVVFVAAILWALAKASGKKEQWVFLRHNDGALFNQWEMAAVAFGAGLAGIGLLHLVWKFQILTLVVVCVCVIIWKDIKTWGHEKFEAARNKRQVAIDNHKKAAPAPMPEHASYRNKTTPSEDVQREAMEELCQDLENM